MQKQFVQKWWVAAFLIAFSSLPSCAASYHTLKVPSSVQDAAYGISNNAEIVGYYGPQSGGILGFLFNNGHYSNLQFPGAPWTYAYGINSSEEIVGSYHLQSGNENDRGYIYKGGKYSKLEYPGSSWTDLFGVNDKGEIVGVYRDSQNYEQGSSTAMESLPKSTSLAPGRPSRWASTPKATSRDATTPSTFKSPGDLSCATEK